MNTPAILTSDINLVVQQYYTFIKVSKFDDKKKLVRDKYFDP